MHVRYCLLLLAALAAPALVHSGEIRRIEKSPPAMILDAAILPPQAEIMILSGMVAAPIGQAPDGSAEFGDTKAQTRSIFGRIKAALEKQGYSMSDIVKLTVFLVADPDSGKADFDGMNEVYRETFGTSDNPAKVARSSLQIAGLANPRFLVEIEAIAARMPTPPAAPAVK